MNGEFSDMPKISIIIPVFNVEKYINRCLETIINQTLKDIEIILVDDGSFDKCPLICDSYSKNDNRIKVIHKKNEGLGFARNSGLDIATGEYIAFVDSDDFVDLDVFEKMYNLAIEKKCDAVLQGNKIYNNGVIKVKETCKRNVLYKDNQIISELLPSIIGADFYGKDYVGMSVWRGIYKASIIKQNDIHFYSERDFISEDIIFDIEFLKIAKKIYVANLYGYYYCINPSSLTHSSFGNKFLLNDALHKKLELMLKEMNATTKSFARLDYTYIFNAKACINNEIDLIKKNGISKVKLNIKEILSSSELSKTLKRFRTKGMPIHKLIYVFMLKHKTINLLILYTKIQKGIIK